MSSPPALRIHLLGSLRLFAGDQPFSFSALPKVVPLWAYLLLHRAAPLPRETFAFTLWPDVPETEARANLRRHLHQLRRALPPAPPRQPWLLAESGGLQWNPAAPCWLDVAEFERCCDDPARWAQGVALYTGDLLPTVYDDWLFAERERLRELQVATLHNLLRQRHAARDFAQAIAYGRQVLALDPLREDVVRALMRLRHESGDRTSALKEFRSFEARLREELDVAPLPETRELHETLSRGPGAGAARQAPPPPNNLPAQLTSFVGRAEELAGLGRLLEGPERLITLSGPGGVGKTRLGLETARVALSTNADRFPDGVFFVPLADLTDPDLVLGAVANVLGVKDGPPSLSHHLQQFLRLKRLLLLLDNFEQLVEAAPGLTDLLTHAPGLRLLVTSRQVLDVYGELEFPVPPLALPSLDPLPVLSDLPRYAAVALFVERARTADPGFRLNADNGRTVAEICYRLDGLPLALELAAARSKLFTPSALLERLGQRLTFLTSSARNLADRQRTLRQTIGWSFNLLPAGEQRCFAALGVFAGSFGPQAAAAVLGQPMLEALAALADKSMLRREPPADLPDEPRFHLLLTLREYALEQLAASGELEAARERLARYFVDLLARAEPEFGAQQVLWSRRLEAEHDSLRAMLEWTLGPTGAAEVGLRLAAGLAEFWKLRGYPGEGQRWLKAALAACPDAPIELQAEALRSLSGLALFQGDIAAAEEKGLASARLWRSLGHAGRAGLASALRNLGIAAWLGNDLTLALERYEESLALEREAANRLGVAGALNNIGLVLQRQGDYPAAIAHYQESLANARDLGNLRLMANALNNLGISAQEQGDYQKARAALEEAIKLYRELGDRSGLAIGLNNLSNAVRPLGDLDAARKSAEQSLELYRELGNPANQASALFMLGAAAHLQGDQAIARACFEEAIDLRQQRGDQRGQLSPLEGLAWVENASGRPARATRLLAAAEALRGPLGASPRSIPNRAEYQRALAAVQARLAPDEFAAEVAAGQQLTLEAALTLARMPT